MEEQTAIGNVLSINDTAKAYLKETAKWSNFLAIIGFIGIGLLIVLSFFMGAVFSALPNADLLPMNYGPILTVIYLIVAVIYFFPVLYLYRFSVRMKACLVRNDEGELTAAFMSLKSLFKFLGIATIVLLVFYLLLFLVALLGVFVSL